MDGYQKGHMAIHAGGLKRANNNNIIAITLHNSKKKIQYKTKPKLTTN